MPSLSNRMPRRHRRRRASPSLTPLSVRRREAAIAQRGPRVVGSQGRERALASRPPREEERWVPKQLMIAVAAAGRPRCHRRAGEDQPKATGVVAVRQAAMKANGDHMTAIKAILTEYPQLIGPDRVPRRRDQGNRRVRARHVPAGQRTAARAGPCRRSGQRPGRVQGGGREGRGLGREAGRGSQGRRRRRRRSPRSRRSARKAAAAATRRSGRSERAEAARAAGVHAGAGGLLAAPPAPCGRTTRTCCSPGELIFHIGGCTNCHTAKNGAAAGRRRCDRRAPFGDFYAPNITPDPTTGIGGWSVGPSSSVPCARAATRRAGRSIRPFPTPPTPT